MTKPLVPVTLLTALLGRGKTMALNHLVRPPVFPSLLAMGAATRLLLALVAAGLLWLAVDWALD